MTYDGEPRAMLPLLRDRSPDHDDALSVYLDDISRHRLLDAEEEVELAQRIEAGADATRALALDPRMSPADKRRLRRVSRRGDAARDAMARANLRLVVSIARRYRASGIQLVDLIQEGNIGLMRAVQKFDWHRGLKFSTYATWWIRQAISRAIADRGRSIRLPVHIHELLARIRRAEKEVAAQYGREPTVTEVADRARLSPERVRELRGVASVALSLDVPAAKEGETTLGDLVPDEEATEQFDRALSDAGRDEILKTLSSLDQREYDIITLRFGLTGEPPRSLEEIGERFALSRERIRQIQQRALAKLRHPSRSFAFRTQD